MNELFNLEEITRETGRFVNEYIYSFLAPFEKVFFENQNAKTFDFQNHFQLDPKKEYYVLIILNPILKKADDKKLKSLDKKLSRIVKKRALEKRKFMNLKKKYSKKEKNELIKKIEDAKEALDLILKEMRKLEKQKNIQNYLKNGKIVKTKNLLKYFEFQKKEQKQRKIIKETNYFNTPESFFSDIDEKFNNELKEINLQKNEIMKKYNKKNSQFELNVFINE